MKRSTVFLSIVWSLSLLYGEWFAYFVPSLWTCDWPHLQRSSHSSSLMNGVDNSGNYVKIVVITDPQLMDRTSLPLAPKSLLLEIAQFYSDLYMRRAFQSSILPFQPDAILFLGDYFDGGDQLSDEEWQESLGRFRHIFNPHPLHQASNINVYNLSGNHDIGYVAYNSRSPEIIKRYEREFGARNFKVTIGKVDFIAIDAQTVDGHPLGDLTSESWNFIKNVTEENDSNPRVLLTHIPLYRPDWTACGLHRTSPVINQRVRWWSHYQDITYQNYLFQDSTSMLLDLMRPALVLSGHDHDQCTVTHMSEHGPVTEHTVGSVSWLQGNWFPSFMLLSATNSSSLSSEEAILTQLCFLPMQRHIYFWYLSLFAITLVVIILSPANQVLVLSRSTGDNIRSLFSSVIKRLLRALREFTAIASINIPLYVLLVSKDWIDKVEARY